MDFSKAFHSLGYTWVDNSIIQPNNIPWYKFDSNYVKSNELETNDQNNDSEQKNQVQHQPMPIQKKQLTLKEMWKK